MRRMLVAMTAAVAAVAALLVPVAGIPVASAPSVPAASAADGRLFDPGNIISDALFFNGAAMNATDVQSFLARQVPSCRQGYTCLKDYRQSTASRAGELLTASSTAMPTVPPVSTTCSGTCTD